MVMSDRIDYSVLRRWEGFDLTAHRPGTRKSGVTIGMGIDLGQRNLHDLRRAGLTQQDVDALTPFLGLKGQAADAALKAYRKFHKKDFSVALAVWEKFEDDYKKFTIQPMIRSYNAALQPGMVRFGDLPPEFQTVIASVTWQYGNLATETPTFWKHITAQDWEAALAELRNFRDHHRSRRHQEADHMEPGLRRLRQ